MKIYSDYYKQLQGMEKEEILSSIETHLNELEEFYEELDCKIQELPDLIIKVVREELSC